MIVLGIDAAWTEKEPSGVALTALRDGEWRCLALAPSYEAFLGLSDGRPVDWGASRVRGTAPDPEQLIQAAASISGGVPPDVVAVDMPMATTPFVTRRTADNLVSSTFGGQWCSAHSPTADRPGAIGMVLSEGCERLGYPLAVATDAPGAHPRLIEVYPHPALLTLLALQRRFEYKASKARKFWPELNLQGRKDRLLEQYELLLARLGETIVGIDLKLPHPTEVSSISALKRYEDALDALVCCWVGACYAEGQAYPLGDDSAAVWMPAPSVLAATALGP